MNIRGKAPEKKSADNCRYSKFDLKYGEWKCRYWSRRILDPKDCRFCSKWTKATPADMEAKEKDKEYEDE